MKLGGFLQGLEGRGPTRLPEAVRKGWPQVDQGWPHVGTDQGSVPGSTQGCRLLPGPHQASPDAQTEHCGAQPTVTRGWAGGWPQRLPTLPCCLPRFLEPSPAREARPAGVRLSVLTLPGLLIHSMVRVRKDSEACPVETCVPGREAPSLHHPPHTGPQRDRQASSPGPPRH